MKREFLKDLGIADEAIDKIMAENGKDVEKVKGERDNYQSQLKTAQATLKSFEGVDVNELKGKVDKLTKDLKTKDDEYAAKLDERDFEAAVKSAASVTKARNHNTVLAALGKEKVDALRASKNREADIKAAFDALKADKDNAYLFNADKPPAVVAPTGGPAKGADDAKSKANDAIRSAFGKGTGE